jgi:peptidoglycan/xylan/chitin deacetylase (PgdA/CDA1 family)
MKIIASWDDGSTADLRMADLMAKYEIETIFYWPSMIGAAKDLAMTSSWLSEKDCEQIASKFEIGSKSVTNKPMNKRMIQAISMEIHSSKKYWQDVTGQEIKSFAYPRNSLNSLNKALIKGAGYTTARTSITGSLNPGNDPHSIQCTVQIGIDRIEYKEKSWELFAQEMINKCDDNSIFHIFGSSWDIESYNDWNALESLIKQIKN